MSINHSDITRSILVVGKTGAGKSKLLNELIGKRIFKSSADTESCTEMIMRSEFERVVTNTNKDGISYLLDAYDTPGIGDTQGRSKQFLNEIAQTIKKTPLNLKIVLIEYGKLDTGLYNNLEILRECLNYWSQSSSMLIVNKVPTKKNLDRKRKNGEEVKDREEMLEEIFHKLSECLGSEFKFKFFLENDDMDDAETFKAEQYELIRQVIYSCSSYLNVSHVRSWNEIVEFYLNEISFDQVINEQITKIIEETNDKLAKIEWDMAEIIYPIRLSQNGAKLELTDFVSKFACNISKEEYLLRESQSKYSSDIKFIFSLKEELIFSLKIKDDFERFLRTLD